MTSGISASFADRARPVLNLIDDLRKIGVQQCVPIPQIAVMGDQSSGKSSVLEAISGIAFPRSAGLCTRCPTQVSMTHGDAWSASVRAGSGSGKEHKLRAGEEYLIANLIEELTAELAGSKSDGGFSTGDDQIEIKLVSPSVPDLTIIDLPGIVRTATKGQSQAVRNQVDAMLDRFLRQERTIVLAVIPANVDIATVDILERAAKVDPDGKRTIGVLTKPDLVDTGAEPQVIDVLANRTKPLLHGYFMVKNRSQKELDSAQNQEASRRIESSWLAGSKYANIPGVSETRLGVPALTSALTELLVDRIVTVLPDMTAEVEQSLKAASAELAKLGSPPPTTAAHCRALAGDIVRQFCRDLRRTCSEASPVAEGTAKEAVGVLQQERKLRKEFIKAVEKTRPGFDGEHDMFDGKVIEVYAHEALLPGVAEKKVGQVVADCSWNETRSTTNVGDEYSVSYARQGFTKAKVISVTQYFRGDLAKRIEERRGREIPGFMSFPVFRDLISEYVGRWEKPTMCFQDNVSDVLSQAASVLASSIAEDWPRLAEKMKEELHIHFAEMKSSASRRLQTQLTLEKTPSTENHYLWDTINKIRDDRMAQRVKAEAHKNNISVDTVCALMKSDVGKSSNESQEVQDMIDMLQAYWKLAKKRFVDEVGMIVTDSYTSPRRIDAIEKRLSSALVLNLDDSSLHRFFGPNRMKEKRREELKKLVQSMKKARLRLQEGI